LLWVQNKNCVMIYFENKINILENIFGAPGQIRLGESSLKVADKIYPIIDDVIILSEPDKYTDYVRSRLRVDEKKNSSLENFSESIQHSFGSEWSKYDKILPEEHEREFKEYFDLVNFKGLENAVVCDLGCGNGRWSYFARDKCRTLALVDFSDAIFVARKNLVDAGNCLFFMCDLKCLPFKTDFCDLLFSIGVLHHLPTPCLDEVRNLKKYSPKSLIYLYYALDNRPRYFRMMLKLVTAIRLGLSKIRSEAVRSIFVWLLTFIFYLPMILLGRLMNMVSLGGYVPLYEAYHDKSLPRIRQDVYDRFFTGIEQRVSRRQISELKDSFAKVVISPNKPYWHFVCER